MRMVKILAAACLVAIAGGPASAGVFADDLAKCLVAHSNPQDTTVLVQWIFSAMSQHPDVRPMSNMSAEQRDAMNVKAADLTMRLLTVDCRKEMVAALKYEGPSSVENAFGILGQAAVQSLEGHPAVAAEMESYAHHLDSAKLQDLFREAGVKPRP